MFFLQINHNNLKPKYGSCIYITEKLSVAYFGVKKNFHKVNQCCLFYKQRYWIKDILV